jgi:hypothetical protein
VQQQHCTALQSRAGRFDLDLSGPGIDVKLKERKKERLQVVLLITYQCFSFFEELFSCSQFGNHP